MTLRKMNGVRARSRIVLRHSASLFLSLVFFALAGNAVAKDRPVSAPYTGDLAIFEDPKRDENLQAWRVMDILRINASSRVADIGAGSGWFTIRAARRVGPSGIVYAVEINRDFLAHIRQRAIDERLDNIRPVFGRADDPTLPPNKIDAVLLLKTYHEIAQPRAFLRHLRPALRAGALVGIIDRNGRGDDHGLDARVVIKEMARAGFAVKSNYDFVKADGDDYFLVFAVEVNTGVIVPPRRAATLR